jgi:hypothetical protein
MTKRLIDRINASLAKEGLKPRSDTARQWLQTKIRALKPSRESLMNDRKKLKSRTIIGKMYFYFYDPKTKDSLPYYDRFPLVIPIEQYADGFLGLNLHYIHPKQRMVLLDKLSDTTNNNKYDETTKLKINYGYLKAASNIFEAQACIKRYLFSHVQSRFLEIESNEWDIAALLPMESFVGASTSKVYADSKGKF